MASSRKLNSSLEYEDRNLCIPSWRGVKIVWKDAHELTKIAIEDNISKTQVINMFHPFKLGLVNRWSEDTILEEVKKYSDEEYVISEIIGRTILSKRYAEKILPK